MNYYKVNIPLKPLLRSKNRTLPVPPKANPPALSQSLSAPCPAVTFIPTPQPFRIQEEPATSNLPKTPKLLSLSTGF